MATNTLDQATGVNRGLLSLMEGVSRSPVNQSSGYPVLNDLRSLLGIGSTLQGMVGGIQPETNLENLAKQSAMAGLGGLDMVLGIPRAGLGMLEWLGQAPTQRTAPVQQAQTQPNVLSMLAQASEGALSSAPAATTKAATSTVTPSADDMFSKMMQLESFIGTQRFRPEIAMAARSMAAKHMIKAGADPEQMVAWVGGGLPGLMQWNVKSMEMGTKSSMKSRITEELVKEKGKENLKILGERSKVLNEAITQPEKLESYAKSIGAWKRQIPVFRPASIDINKLRRQLELDFPTSNVNIPRMLDEMMGTSQATQQSDTRTRIIQELMGGQR